MERRIYFKALSEILLKKQSDFMQFKVIFHWSKVKYLCSLTAEKTKSFNYKMTQDKEKRIPCFKSPSALICNCCEGHTGQDPADEFWYLSGSHVLPAAEH